MNPFINIYTPYNKINVIKDFANENRKFKNNVNPTIAMPTNIDDKINSGVFSVKRLVLNTLGENIPTSIKLRYIITSDIIVKINKYETYLLFLKGKHFIYVPNFDLELSFNSRISIIPAKMK